MEKFQRNYYYILRGEANEDINSMYEILKNLKDIIIEFEEEYAKLKREKNVIDFNDIEHFALKTLVKKENEKYVPADVAKSYQEKFTEIAIDEYQDSNLIQEYILNTISRNHNLFMVGDVKQSIYKFRQARPELFLEKYNTYGDGSGIKIKLFKNFRSRQEILDLTNIVFNNIMSKQLGDIDYTKEEYLNLGAQYPISELNVNYDCKPEIHVINCCQEEKEEIEPIENDEIEAKFVADKIEKMLNSNYMVWDREKNTYRKLEYKDIVILLRSANSLSNIYEKEISQKGYPVYSEATAEYLDSNEISTIIAILKIIDNPNQDIELVTVLRSPIYSFTDNELIEIRLFSKKGSFYDALKIARKEAKENLKQKIEQCMQQIDQLRQEQEYMPLDEFIWHIYSVTGYDSYVSLMPNGELRLANLRMLFEQAQKYEQTNFKGLYNFINFIQKIKKSNSDIGAAKIIGENDNVIRIMSIHKSKGLEFPVVFLCSTAKNINMQDLNESILLHQEIGLGPQYINHARKIEYATLAKEAIKIKSMNEVTAEEMRILYVALTRAKEKLIITGVEKDAEKALDEKQQILNSTENKINVQILKKYKSYLDWLEFVYLKEKLNSNIEFTVENKNTFFQLKEKNNEHNEIYLEKAEVSKEIKDLLNWKYPREEATKIISKTSVTGLKEIENKQEKQIIPKATINPPKFLQMEQKITNAEIGTATHFILQKLNLKKEHTKEELNNFIEELVIKNLLTIKQAKSINQDKIFNFLKSEIAKKVRKAQSIYQEVPFYINLKANEIYDTNIEDTILVQGIIDLYFIDNNKDIILVDYKTDYVENKKEEILVEKYKKQIEIYERAIQEATNQNVKEKYIYSLYLNKAIRV